MAIFLAALGFRCLVFGVAGDHALLRRPVVDAGYQDAWARRIAAGDWLGHGPDDVFKPPLYPTFLAGLYLVFGRSIAVVQWVQHLAGAASCVLVAVVACRLLGRGAGRAAGLLSGVYAPYVFFELQLLTPAASVVLGLGALALVVTGRGRPGRWRLAAAGLLLGLSAGVRPDVLLPAALVTATVLLRDRRSWRAVAADAACLAAPVAAVVLAIAARNHYLTGHFIPVSSNAGINFYVGNAAGSDGVSAVPVGLRWERLISRVPQEVLERPATASRWWMRAGWREMGEAPWAALGRLGRKAVAFWSRREFRNNIGYHYFQREAWPLLVSPLQWATIVPLAAVGLLALWRSQDARERMAAWLCSLWVGGYWVAGIAFFVTARFRLPAVPLLLVPAAWGLVRMVAAARERRWRELLGRAGIVLAAGAVCWPPWLGSGREGRARDHVNLGNSLREGGALRDAQAAYRSALEIAPDDPDAHYLLARTVLGRRPHEALEHLAAARRVLPASPDVLLATAEAHLAASQSGRAREVLGELLRERERSNLLPKRGVLATAHVLLAELEPSRASAHWDQAWAVDPRTAAEASFLQRRDLGRARQTFERQAREQPWDWYAQANHGLALLDAGRAERAAAAFHRAARLSPERPRLRVHLARALIDAGRGPEAARLLRRLRAEHPAGPMRREIDALLARARAGDGGGD